jgi:hypothetical protein
VVTKVVENGFQEYMKSIGKLGSNKKIPSDWKDSDLVLKENKCHTCRLENKMKETKYITLEHKNRQPLKNVHTMRQLFNRGFYKFREQWYASWSIVALSPEIYGNIAEEK